MPPHDDHAVLPGRDLAAAPALLRRLARAVESRPADEASRVEAPPPAPLDRGEARERIDARSVLSERSMRWQQRERERARERGEDGDSTLHDAHTAR